MEKRSHVELLQDLIEETVWELDLLDAFDDLEGLPEYLYMLLGGIERRAKILEGLGVRKYVG